MGKRGEAEKKKWLKDYWGEKVLLKVSNDLMSENKRAVTPPWLPVEPKNGSLALSQNSLTRVTATD